MKEADALRIIAYLNAAYPGTALDEASVLVFATEVALLYDPEIGMEAAKKVVRNMSKFPSIADFRSMYRSVNEIYNSDLRHKEIAAADTYDPIAPPEWVGIWWWSTHYRDPVVTRVPAEMAGRGFEPLTIQEYAQLQTEWREAGSPMPGSLIPGMKKV